MGGDGHGSVRESEGNEYSTSSKKFQKLDFTMTHCFYALMGGFIIGTSRITTKKASQIQHRVRDTSRVLKII